MMRTLLMATFMMCAAAAGPGRALASGVIHLTDARVMEADRPDFARPDFNDSDWKRLSVSDVDPQKRLLWLRAEAHGDALAGLERPLALYVSALAAHQVYFNGAPIGTSGMPASEPSDEIPGVIDAVHHLPADLIRPGKNVIAIRMSSHHLPSALDWPMHNLYISTFRAPSLLRLQTYLPAMIAGGAILLGGVYFLGLFAADRRDTASLALGLLAVAVVGQLAAESWRGLASYAYPLHMTRLHLIVGFAALGGAALTAFAGRLFAPHRLHFILPAAAGLAAIGIVFVPGYDSKTGLAILIFVCAALLAAAIGAVDRRPGARFAVLGFAAFLAAAFWRPEAFLDQTYYLLMAGLILALFALQIRLRSSDRRRREEASLEAARLRHELLKRQIQPHFLMNTLTSLAEWMETDPKAGADMIDALGREMRLLYDISERTLIPLTDELELCRQHLKVMSRRADADFQLRTGDIPDGIHCPPAILLTLIENAFTHNEYRENAAFEVDATVGNDEISIRCRTPIRAPAGKTSRTGTGLAYIRARLKEAFGERWALRSEKKGDVWQTAISWRRHDRHADRRGRADGGEAIGALRAGRAGPPRWRQRLRPQP